MTKKKVYSYLRFSTATQGDGDSTRRQTDFRDRWLAAHPDYVLDKTIRLLDEGFSGYHGEHLSRGALGEFLEIVKKGEIPPGSVLLVEQVDRLTRGNTMDAFELCTGLIKEGIAIATELTTYDEEALNTGAVHGLIAEIQRAHNESKIKSTRVRAARDAAFEEAYKSRKIVTSRGPAWLYKTGEREWSIQKYAKETIQRVFEMKLEGNSVREMLIWLNANARWMPKGGQGAKPGKPSSGWGKGYVGKILSSRTVLGEYQPYQNRDGKRGSRKPVGPPIPGYYPTIVDEATFNAVQKMRPKAKGTGGGRAGKYSNVFRHLAKCAYCDGSMHFYNKGSGWTYLACERSARGLGCQYRTVRYQEAQDLILEACSHLDPAQVLPAKTEQQAVVKNLASRATALREKIAERKGRIEKYVDMISRSTKPKMQDRYEDLAGKLDEEIALFEPELEQVDNELEKATQSRDCFKDWQSALPELVAAVDDPEAGKLRTRLSTHLRDHIDKIEIFPVGFQIEADRSKHFIEKRTGVVVGEGKRKREIVKRGWQSNVETIVETMDAMRDAASDVSKAKWIAFEKYVLDRRMSKEGRFYRIHFTGGGRVDIVPPGGLATGVSIAKTEKPKKVRGKLTSGGTIEKTLPDFEALWSDFVGGG